MLEIKEIKNKKTWEDFITREENTFYPLFQSWNWGKVQEILGFPITRLGIYENHTKIVGVFQLIDVRAKRGHYVHVRHGPVLLSFTQKYFEYFIIAIKKIALELGASFIRMSPLIERSKVDNVFFSRNKLHDAPIHNMDAELCWVLDITKAENEILKGMRKSHRYLIRKGLVMDIKIIRSQNMNKFEEFEKLYKHLYQRKRFTPHKDIKEEYEIFSSENQSVLLLAEYVGRVIGGAVILFAGNSGFYRHGATLSGYEKVPVSYLLQWHAILESKKRGKKVYNFWGISPKNNQKHPWYGLTLFKSGFGGESIEFIHAKDIPLGFTYYKSYIIDYFTKIIKGYR